MDLEYDQKFEEMKQYIPFLESMIKRLENTSGGASNPRQAQLDKIRSLRDLLHVKKKRMKMENLLKCEQVLINLYAKVEQRDTLPGIKKASDPLFPPNRDTQDKSDLNEARSKLKNITVTKEIQEDHEPDTLPDISRASRIDFNCIPGSKEPALFQRRPYKLPTPPSPPIISTNKSSSKSPQKPVPKRNYTRRLVSPEPEVTRRKSSSDKKEHSTRRSGSSSDYKKERKNTSGKKRSKDLITLKVPQDSLNSFNTENILSRIINCKDGDVDIDTLRDLRKQILGELKQTNTSDDITDLLIKSYKKKNNKMDKKKNDVEEGELSDSESEAIENIYGSLVVVDKDNTSTSTSEANTSAKQDQEPRKIHICLVFNSDKEKTENNVKVDKPSENIELEMYGNIEMPKIVEITDEVEDESTKAKAVHEIIDEIILSTSAATNNEKVECTPKENYVDTVPDIIKLARNNANFYKPLNRTELISIDESLPTTKDDPKCISKDEQKFTSKDDLKSTSNDEAKSTSKVEQNSTPKHEPKSTSKDKKMSTIQDEPESISVEEFERSASIKKSTDNTMESIIKSVEIVPSEASVQLEEKSEKDDEYKIVIENKSVEIPLLNTEPIVPALPEERSVVSEIDILQALKNDILSDSIVIPGTESATPALHLPKITKVINPQEVQKKRISIEKYKEKATSSPKPPLLQSEGLLSSISKDLLKKQSLKLTEKECERFRSVLEYSSDEDHLSTSSPPDIYSDLAPKSPENEEIEEDDEPPIIIPADPVKTVASSASDVDMRRTSLLSPPKLVPPPNFDDLTLESNNSEKPPETYRPPPVDPRLRREYNRMGSMDSPNSINSDKIASLMSVNATPRGFMSPNVRSFEMTPTRQGFEMTPSRQNCATDDDQRRKHVYAPIFSPTDPRNQKETSNTRDPVSSWESVRTSEGQAPHWDEKRDQSLKWVKRNKREMSAQREHMSERSRYDKFQADALLETPRTPVHHFGRTESPSTPLPSFGRDPPRTPIHHFGRTECPTTPLPSFGRDPPRTPIHHFGRTESPSTPLPSFGRDPPRTPVHPFGRGDSASQYSGRSDSANRLYSSSNVTLTSSHQSFRRSEYSHGNSESNTSYTKDPRLRDRNTEYEYRRQSQDYDRERQYVKNKNMEPYKDTYSHYNPEHSGGKHDKQRRYDSSLRRETSVGRTMSRDNNESIYSRDRNYDRNDRYKIDNRVRVHEERTDDRGRMSAARMDDKYPPYAGHSDNKVCVTSKSGHSFTIDTSVNRTFQDFLVGKGLQVFDYSVDNRRQRATSVGRSLVSDSHSVRNARESSVGRTLAKSHEITENSIVNRRPNFSRAQSVGRVLCSSKQDRSFSDIKADFKSYRDNMNANSKAIKTNRSEEKRLYVCEVDRSSRHQSNLIKPSYSPRKNQRDPRMQRAQDQFSKYNEGRQRKSHGIVYSNDNIAKGTILGTGYGVKNYKIPKIKRVEEPKEEIPLTVDKPKESNEKSNKKESLSNEIQNTVTNTKKDESKTTNKRDKNLQKENLNARRSSRSRVSRDSIESKIDELTSVRTRRKKRVVLSDSDDSDDNKCLGLEKTEKSKIRCTSAAEQNIKSKQELSCENLDSKPDIKETSFAAKEPEVSVENVFEKVLDSEDKDDLLNSSFGLDDLFPENLPVMNNINTLIANLENDISTTDKNSDTLSDDISIEKMLKNICNSDDRTSDDRLEDLTESLGSSTSNMAAKTSSPVKTQKPQQIQENIAEETSAETTINKTTSLVGKNCDLVDNGLPITQDIDSTTGAEQQSEKNITKPSASEVSQSNPIDFDRSSTPDSTINVAEATKLNDSKSLPDSTSTHDADSKNVTATEGAPSKSENELSTIENLLSILQDKGKIQKLLNMLGESENDKIKKKLEKLSEIVSDEETKEPPNQATEEVKQSDESNKNTEGALELEKELTQEGSDIVVDKQTEADKNKKCVETKYVSTPDSPVKPRETAKAKKPAKKLKRGRKPVLKGKRITRSTIKKKPAKMNRELKKLQDDIKEMFIKDDVLNATGIRMCRIAKLVNDKSQETDDDEHQSPKVVLQKFKEPELDALSDKKRKKPGPKPKSQKAIEEPNETKAPEKTITKGKAKKSNEPGRDPYEFESETATDSNNVDDDDDDDDFSSSLDSDSESFQSSESMEPFVPPKKKPKRKRGRGWQAGFIQKKKRKIDTKTPEPNVGSSVAKPIKDITNTDCFTDKSYCFAKSVLKYNCRMCEYNGKDIVNHYKTAHPHSEVPLSRMHPVVAKQAIDQCGKVNFQSISKVPSEKYVCRFCYKQIKKRQKGNLEAFFWHIVSTHTGEYKLDCTECVNDDQCPFHLHIPSPPKDVQGQLIGYICGKCNFTQISLENLKTHVIVRHNDEQTAVYTINLAVMTNTAFNTFIKQMNTKPRVLRSSRSNQSITEASDDPSDTEESSEVDTPKKEIPKLPAVPVTPPGKKIRSKISFETEDPNNDTTYYNPQSSENLESALKTEKEDNEVIESLGVNKRPASIPAPTVSIEGITPVEPAPDHSMPSDDITDYPHFKIKLTETGTEEYVCCINGHDNHFKSPLIIQMKRHIQMKHTENWDGYCYVCKLIVTSQGSHTFKEHFQHLLDKHRDEFPVLENVQTEVPPPAVDAVVETSLPEAPIHELPTEVAPDKNPSKTYINVRPLSELISNEANPPEDENIATLPIIQSVISLNSSPLPTLQPPIVVASMPSPLPAVSSPEPVRKYEETQQEVMSKKHRVVLDAMMCKNVLVKIFKCAGCYCSFSTDSVDEALVHASNHERLGGENSLICAYCDFDCGGNSIDLVTHVFNTHAQCQYACGHCFYRAVASQLVRAHMLRVHGEEIAKESVLVTTTAPTGKDDVTGMLDRSKAVSYYVCTDEESKCKFKTFTQGKFIEHLSKHQTSAYKCYYCSQVYPDPAKLCDHIKSHGIKLFQCTWCVHGADNEADLLDHASALHPTKQPQAYLRVIISKDNSMKRMVLPLAQYNTAAVPTETVVPCNKIQDPRREAVRSVNLENLVSSNSVSINPLPQTESEPIQTIEPPVMDSLQEEAPIPADVLQLLEAALPTSSRLVTISPLNSTARNLTPPPSTSTTASPPPTSKSPPQPIVNLTPHEPIVNLNPPEPTVNSTPPEPIVNLAPPEPIVNINLTSARPKANLTLPRLIPIEKPPSVTLNPTSPLSTTNLNSLPSTSKKGEAEAPIVCKTEAPVKTTATLHSVCPEIVCLDSDDDDVPPPAVIDLNDDINPAQPDPLKDITGFLFTCSVCDITFTRVDSLRAHFKETHPAIKDAKLLATKNKRGFSCHNCTASIKPPFGNVKRHMRTVHKVTEFIVASPVDSPPTAPVLRKRKRSLETVETAPKRKCYGPQDVDNLPMKPILDEVAYCSVCSFSSKVRTNMVRHLNKHAEMEPVAQSVPVNPVPHLETNEMHFDKMLNLASSSIGSRTEKPSRAEQPQSAAVPPELIARCPKYVPEKQRYACGAKGCNYISVDESMLKCHWKTLHAGATDYHCVHCPPHQHLDPSVPLTAARVIAHLKMHDARLYGCSTCAHYYHYKLEMLEKHVHEVHAGKGQVLVVRHEGTPATSAAAAPTMDLKPWNCGLCNFKNMLRQTVAEHCAKNHNSKMQFKCPNCPFRTSAIENVTKHRSSSHPTSTEEIIYYYYREGSIPDEADGTPRWMKQRQALGLDVVKPEVVETVTSQEPVTPVTIPTVDLNLVKQEVEEDADLTVEDLCKRYGQVCQPNGLKYKCPLCKVVMEDSRDAMQSHLYEELKYRKWGCSICSYKAFHKRGLTDHMVTEHRQNRDAIELPLKRNVETWVAYLLDYQESLIQKTKDNFDKQRIISEKRVEQTPAPAVATTSSDAWKDKTKELQDAFGSFGEAKTNEYCCPKCDVVMEDEAQMKTHLELELNKIRWRCSKCSARYQDFHEALSHTRGHPPTARGARARLVEAPRDPAMRAAWVAAALLAQRPTRPPRLATPTADNDADDSLLVVRYQEDVPTPELTPGSSIARKKPASPDSDDERLVIDEPFDDNPRARKKDISKHCPYCDFSTNYPVSLSFHILRHYDLRPYKCSLCDMTGHSATMTRHIKLAHPGLSPTALKVEIPSTPPTHLHPDKLKRRPSKQETEPVEVASFTSDASKDICLVCEKTVLESEKSSHNHDNVTPQFAKKGDVVVKCCLCLALFADVVTLQAHNTAAHPDNNLNYAYFKLHFDTRDILSCGYCDKKFKFIRDMRSHHNAVHSALTIKYTSQPFVHGHFDLSETDSDSAALKRGSADAALPPVKRVAKKSTTKLPSQTVAKKSTTKLPFAASEYSYYGTKPNPLDNYSKVTTLMEIYNKMVPVTMNNFSKILNIEPKVVVKDINKK